MFHLQTPFLGSSQACLMNLGNVELDGVKKSTSGGVEASGKHS
jgi:hypothetical protein